MQPKLSFIRLSLILFCNLLLIMCITKKTFFTLTITTDRNNDNLISICTFNTRELVIIVYIKNIHIKLVTKYYKVHYREFMGIKISKMNKFFFVESRENHLGLNMQHKEITSYSFGKTIILTY